MNNRIYKIYTSESIDELQSHLKRNQTLHQHANLKIQNYQLRVSLLKKEIEIFGAKIKLLEYLLKKSTDKLTYQEAKELLLDYGQDEFVDHIKAIQKSSDLLAEYEHQADTALKKYHNSISKYKAMHNQVIRKLMDCELNANNCAKNIRVISEELADAETFLFKLENDPRNLVIAKYEMLSSNLNKYMEENKVNLTASLGVLKLILEKDSKFISSFDEKQQWQYRYRLLIGFVLHCMIVNESTADAEFHQFLQEQLSSLPAYQNDDVLFHYDVCEDNFNEFMQQYTESYAANDYAILQQGFLSTAKNKPNINGHAHDFINIVNQLTLPSASGLAGSNNLLRSANDIINPNLSLDKRLSARDDLLMQGSCLANKYVNSRKLFFATVILLGLTIALGSAILPPLLPVTLSACVILAFKATSILGLCAALVSTYSLNRYEQNEMNDAPSLTKSNISFFHSAKSHVSKDDAAQRPRMDVAYSR